MSKKIKLLVLLAFFAIFSSSAVLAEEITYANPEGYNPEKNLYILDEGSHLPHEFTPVLNEIISYHPNYTKGEVVYLTVSAYRAVQKDNPDVSMYEVTKDVRRFAEDDLGIDLATLTAAYVRSQVEHDEN
ncbi:MAG: hypothetical protein JW867_08350 [Candidatus Omnitrophica bacterium]|nr:hypothetical protein [Candidatus Omnitrophota bacterium]